MSKPQVCHYTFSGIYLPGGARCRLKLEVFELQLYSEQCPKSKMHAVKDNLS